MAKTKRRKPRNLREAAEFEADELGEYWDLLIKLKKYGGMMEDEFKAAFEKEYKEQEEYAKTHFEVVEFDYKETYTRTDRTLEWLGDN